MKKILSLALSVVMLISCITAGGMNAFAYKLADVPTVHLGDTFSVNAPVLNVDEDMEEEDADVYFAKFTPEVKGYYEFVFDTKFSGKDDEAVMTGIYSYKQQDLICYALCMKVPAELKELEDLLGVTDSYNVASELNAGEDYALVVMNGTKKALTANVTLQTHTHSFKTYNERAFVDGEDMDFNWDGEKYTGCTVNNCTYHKTIQTYYSVKSVKLSKTAYTYDGKTKKPAVTVKDRKGNKLKKDKDYTVTYSKNKAIGTGKVTVKFKGNYEGKVVKNFKINPKGTSLSKVTAKKKGFTAKWKKQTKNPTGYQIQYSTSKKFTKKTTKTVTVSKNSATSKTVTKLKGKKKYYVRVRTYKTVSKKKYYSSWSKVKTVTTRK